MRGQHRADESLPEELAEIGRADTGLTRMRQRAGKRARLWRAGLSPHLPDVVLVLGDIGQMREITEGAHDANGDLGRHAVEDGFQFKPRRPVIVPVEPDRGLPDALDQIEYIGAFLVAYGIAEDAAKQPDVFAEPYVFLKGGDILAAIGADD